MFLSSGLYPPYSAWKAVGVNLLSITSSDSDQPYGYSRSQLEFRQGDKVCNQTPLVHRWVSGFLYETSEPGFNTEYHDDDHIMQFRALTSNRGTLATDCSLYPWFKRKVRDAHWSFNDVRIEILIDFRGDLVILGQWTYYINSESYDNYIIQASFDLYSTHTQTLRSIVWSRYWTSNLNEAGYSGSLSSDDILSIFDRFWNQPNSVGFEHHERSFQPAPVRIVEVSVADYQPPEPFISTQMLQYPKNMGELSAAAVENIRLTSGNGLAFLKDAKDIAEMAKSSADLLRSIPATTSASSALKLVSSAYLSIRYGYDLFFKDCAEFAKAGIDYFYQNRKKCRLTSTSNPDPSDLANTDLWSVGITDRYSIYYDPFSRLSSNIEKFLVTMDATPSLENLWDFIPFSFVVDWFANIGDLAHGIEAFHDLQVCDIHYCITSRLGTATLARRPAGTFGNIVSSFYVRHIDTYVVNPVFRFEVKNPVPNLQRFVDAGALVVTNLL